MQPSLLDLAPRFQGPDLAPADQRRLGRQLEAVRQVMADERWRTLRQISELVDAPESSVSARLRDLRKSSHGQYAVDRKRSAPGSGLWLYRVRVGEP